MTEYSVDYIVEQVRIIIDQNQVENSILENETNTLQTDDIIRRSIAPAAKQIIDQAPPDTLGAGVPLPFDNEQLDTIGDGDIYVLQVPDDFMRLVILQLGSWRRPVTELLADSSPQYILAQSRFSGIGGNAVRPLAFMTTDEEGHRVIELYRGMYGDYVRKARYIPAPEESDIRKGATMRFPARLFNALLYHTAALTETTLNNAQMAQSFFTVAKNLLANEQYNALTEQQKKALNNDNKKR